MPNEPYILFVGLTYVNSVPAKDREQGVETYVGGEAPWAAASAAYTIHKETRKEKQKGKTKNGRTQKSNPAEKPAAEAMLAAYLRKGPRHQSFEDRDDESEIRTDAKIDNVRVVALTTLSEEQKDQETVAARAALRQAGIEIMASDSHMPVDVYKSRNIQDSNIDERHFDEERPFNLDAAYRQLSKAESLPAVAVFNGIMLGNKKAQGEFLELAQWLRDKGVLIIADLRAPMDRPTVKIWAKMAHVIKMSANECEELIGHKHDATAANSILKDGAKLVFITKGREGSASYWDNGQLVHQGSAIVQEHDYVHCALPVRTSYNPKTKFKAGAAFVANLALSMIKFGIDASNIGERVKIRHLVENLGKEAVEKTTSFLKIADKLTRWIPLEQPLISKPISRRKSAAKVIEAVYGLE